MLNFSFLKSKKVFVKNNVQPNANLFWMILFFLGFVLTLIIFIFGFFLFMKINTDDNSTSLPESRELKKINKIRIDKVLSIFSDRAKVSEDIINSQNSIIDPSL